MSSTAPISSGGYRVCPLCERRLATVQLLHAWVCENCRNGFALRRVLALGLDFLVLTLAVWVPVSVAMKLYGEPVFVAVWPVFCGVLFFFRDGLGGTSPGKWILGLRVVNVLTRQRAGALASLKRNLILLVPGVNLVAAVLILNGTRLGDGWAGTTVVWRRYAAHYPFSAEAGRYCIECGYDLTGNRSGRCPECGSAVLEAARRACGETKPLASASNR